MTNEPPSLGGVERREIHATFFVFGSSIEPEHGALIHAHQPHAMPVPPQDPAQSRFDEGSLH